MIFFENIYLNILAGLLIIMASIYTGYFLRNSIKDGKKEWVFDTGTEAFVDVLISFIIGFIAVATIIYGISQWFI